MNTTDDFLLYALPGDTDWNCHRLRRTADAQSDLVVKPFTGRATNYTFESQDLPPFERELALKAPDAIFQRDEAAYRELVKMGVEFSRFHKGKVVLSRSRDVAADTQHWARWMMRLRMRLPNTFTYLFHSAEYGTWMGATPEVLVKRKGMEFETVSLAGTKWEDEAFSEKEFIEQEVVTQEILSSLSLDETHAGERVELEFGPIRHLCTPIRWRSNEDAGWVAERLHPTPAVCGHPKRQAKAFIDENEKYDRALYTGFMMVKPSSDEQMAFVNLRCMQLFEECVRIFAGGGVNALSDPKSEWLETEFKMGSILESLSAKEDI